MWIMWVPYHMNHENHVNHGVPSIEKESSTHYWSCRCMDHEWYRTMKVESRLRKGIPKNFQCSLYFFIWYMLPVITNSRKPRYKLKQITQLLNSVLHTLSLCYTHNHPIKKTENQWRRTKRNSDLYFLGMQELAGKQLPINLIHHQKK